MNAKPELQPVVARGLPRKLPTHPGTAEGKRVRFRHKTSPIALRAL